MHADRHRWNARYSEQQQRSAAADVVRNWCGTGPGRALDVACGDGGNCLLLAAAGFAVDAVDIADRAIERLAGLPGITPIRADLDTWRPARASYQLIIMCMFFDRRLLPHLRAALVPGGRIIIKCFSHAPDGTLASPANPDFAARPNELAAAFSDCTLRHQAHMERPRDDRPSAWIAELVADAPSAGTPT